MINGITSISWFSFSSGPFVLATCAALVLLAIHAAKTHGWLFGVIWLGLSSALTNSIALALTLAEHGVDSFPRGVVFPGTADGSLFLNCSFYLSALLAKGFVERSALKGSPLAFATMAAGLAALFAKLLDVTNRIRMECWTMRVDDLCVRTEQDWYRLGFPVPAGFDAGFVAGVFAFALAYRLVSLRTQRNGVKAGVLALLLPFLAAAASGVACVGRTF